MGDLVLKSKLKQPNKEISLSRARVRDFQMWASYLAFLMAFPVVVIPINLSFLVFPVLIYKSQYLPIPILRVKSLVQILFVLIIVGVIVNAFYVGEQEGMLSRQLRVLPNYIYWCLMGIFLINVSKYLNLHYI